MSSWAAFKLWISHATRFVGKPQPAYHNDAERQQFEHDCIQALGYKGDELVMLTEHDLFKIWRAGTQRGVAPAPVPLPAAAPLAFTLRETDSAVI